MKKLDFWKADWFLGVVVVLAIVVFNRTSDLIPSLERKAYDLGVTATARTPSDKIAVIGIDDQSLANIGRWPWSREVLAKMTDRLTDAKAKVIGYTVLFAEPQVDPGYVYISKLLAVASKSATPSTDLAAPPTGDLAVFYDLLREAELALNTDRKLSESFARAGNVVPMMLFEIGVPQGKPDKPLPEFVAKNALPKVGEGVDEAMLPTRRVDHPIETIGKAAAALGHLNATPDVDGGTRTEPLVIAYYGQVFPSLSMMIAAKSLNLGVSDIQITPGEKVSLQRLNITTDPLTRMYTYFYKDRDGRPAFPVDSFYDVYIGKIPVEKYRDKIVLIGPTAPGLGSATVTPVSPAMPPVQTLAHSVSSILSEHFFVTPAWGGWVEILIFLLIAAYLIALLPKLKAGQALAISGGVFVALLAAHFILMTGKRHVAAAHVARDAAAHRPRCAGVQALYRDRARETQVRRDGRRIEPHAGHRLPGAGPARSRLGQVPPGADGGRGDGQPVQPGARLRTQATIQQGRVGVPLHGGLQPEVPRPRPAADACQSDVRHGHPGRRRAVMAAP